jgi:hypothetical protein
MLQVVLIYLHDGDTEDAQVAYNRTNLTVSHANIDDAYADMIIARNSLEKAWARFDKVANKFEGNLQCAQQ